MTQLGKSFAYAATYLKLLSTKTILIWSSLRAEYTQMLFKEHEVKSGRRHGLSVEWWGMLLVLFLHLCAKWIHNTRDS